MEGVAAPSVVDEKIYLIILFFKLPSDPLQIFFKVTYCDFEAGHFLHLFIFCSEDVVCSFEVFNGSNLCRRKEQKR